MSTTTTKSYSSRSSATAVLKKAGIAVDQYDAHLERLQGGRWAVKGLPSSHAIIESKIASSKREAKAMKAAKEPRVTVAGTIRALIKEGKTNEEIVAKLHLPESKQHYPSWYRSQMKRAKAEA